MGMTQEAMEARRDYKRQYRSENREKINARQREWRAENRDKVRQYNEKYWAKVAESGRNPRYNSWEDYGIDKDRLAELRAVVRSGKYDNLVREAAYTANEKAAEHILLSVKENLTYEHVEFHEKLGRICIGRTDFYSVRRLFFHYLDCALKEVNESTCI